MLSLGPLAFAAPWALGAVTFLPVLWWLLKVTPPSPRTVRFPAVRLLFGLEAREDAAARTPWWVLALRLALALAIILAVAHPLVHPGQPLARAGGPLAVAVDDGWASARDWAERKAYLDEVLARAERADRPVVLITTAPPADGAPLASSGLVPAARARALVQALEPKPWAVDRAAAARLVAALPRDRSMAAVWLADGLDAGDGADFARALQSLGGGLEIVTGRTARALLPPDPASPADRLLVTLRRLAGTDDPERVAVRALDAAGKVLGREEAMVAPGQDAVTVALRLPTELRNRLTRLDVEGERGAASTVLLDERWRRRPVGLAGGGDPAAAPLLGRLYYVDKALAPHAELHHGEVSELLGRPLAVMVLADLPAVPGTTGERLEAWVRNGGVLVRFAGPALAHAASETRGGAPDPLLPVRPRAGGRSLGGAMSWAAPQGLAPFPESSPFAGLPVPADVTVAAQVLAEPTIELNDRTWARLADGTPLVTGVRLGKGWTVLVHTTANADWSTLALSGLFPDMLRRLVALGDGIAAPGGGDAALPPAELLDGLGRLTAPSGAAAALSDPARAVPGPRNPPGLYGDGAARLAFNLGPRVGTPRGLAAPSGAAETRLGERPREIDLRPALLAIAVVLAVADLLAALALRGLLGRRGAAACLALLAAFGFAPPGRAAEADAFAMEAALSTRLAYVRTGDAAVDAKSKAGLAALSRLLAERSTAALAEPMAVSVETDPVLFFPLLYWPVTAGQAPPSAKAAEKLNDYMRRGGLIVFDAADGAEAALPALTAGLAVPPLAPVDEEHVLTRSFYLLKELPGRAAGAPVWVAAADATGTNDGVSPVVVGAADWAGAWAADERGRPLHAVAPGGERQRELAYRFGVNLVMYALTGNYKADQVHLPAIMERLGR